MEKNWNNANVPGGFTYIYPMNHCLILLLASWCVVCGNKNAAAQAAPSLEALYSLEHTPGELQRFAQQQSRWANFDDKQLIRQADERLQRIAHHSDSIFQGGEQLDRLLSITDFDTLRALIEQPDERGNNFLDSAFVTRVFGRAFDGMGRGRVFYEFHPLDEQSEWPNHFALMINDGFSWVHHLYFFAGRRIVARHEFFDKDHSGFRINHFRAPDEATVIWFERILSWGSLGSAHQQNYQFYRYEPSGRLLPLLNELASSYRPPLSGNRNWSFVSEVVSTDPLTIKRRYTDGIWLPNEGNVEVVCDSIEVEYVWQGERLVAPQWAQWHAGAYHIIGADEEDTDRLFLYTLDPHTLETILASHQQGRWLAMLYYLNELMGSKRF